MHFAKLNYIFQMKNNPQFPQLPINSPSNHRQQRTGFDSEPLHSRSHSSNQTQHPLIIRLESLSEMQEPSIHSSSFQKDFIKNPLALKSKKYLILPQEKTISRGFLEGKMRRTSQINIVFNTVIHQIQQIQHDKNEHINSIKGSQLISKKSANFKERKASCNLEFPSFFKKTSQNNWNPRPFKRNKIGLNKKKSMGWDENNNCQFSINTNSDQCQFQQQQNIFAQIPKIQSIRKKSDNESPKKYVPSFLNNFKNHKNSVDQIDFLKKNRLSIQNFMIVRQLGRGTFGRVVLGLQRQSKTIFAIKILAKRQVRQGVMVEQLIREIKIQQYINHPNVIKIYGFFDDLLHFYIIMECALDPNLYGIIQSHTTNSIQPANIMNQICKVVSFLHSEQIIHRDLKPENILFHQGVVKISDFGWSVRRDGNLRTTFCGTPLYLCPEILVGNDYDESVDIWTIGMILYQIYYKTNPFKIERQEELVNILNQPIHYDQRIQISPSAKGFIDRCLKKRAIDRPSIRQLLLHQFLLSAASQQELKR